MKQNPRVSIIINNYNYGQFLTDAIDSALCQTLSETEVIVVDDGSTDNSKEIIVSYGTRITPVFNKNEGQASAFNSGVCVCKGSIVIFLDADDMLNESAAEFAAIPLSDPNVVNVCWRLWEIDQHGRLTGAIHPRGDVAMGELRRELINNGPVSKAFPPTSGNAWSREYLRHVMPIQAIDEKHGADGFLSLLAPLYGRVEWLATPQSRYRCHPGQFTAKGALWRMRRDLRRFVAKCNLLQEHMRRQGILVDPEAWGGSGSSYSWIQNMLLIHSEIEKYIPSRAQFVLIDDDLLGVDFFAPYRVVPFTESNGLFAGPPLDDAEAIETLEHHYLSGFEYLVLISSSFWWLNHYSGFAQYLRSHALMLVSNNRLIVFALNPAGRRRYVEPHSDAS